MGRVLHGRVGAVSAARRCSAADVHRWVEQVRGWPISDAAARNLALAINSAGAVLAASQLSDRDRRIAQAIATLAEELPGLIAEAQPGGDGARQWQALAEHIVPLAGFCKAAIPTKGRPGNRAQIAAALGGLVARAWQCARPGRAPTLASRDAFVGLVMAWLGVPSSDATAGRRRRRSGG